PVSLKAVVVANIIAVTAMKIAKEAPPEKGDKTTEMTATITAKKTIKSFIHQGGGDSSCWICLAICFHDSTSFLCWISDLAAAMSFIFPELAICISLISDCIFEVINAIILIQSEELTASFVTPRSLEALRIASI